MKKQTSTCIVDLLPVEDEDSVECSVRKRNGDLIASCYFEFDSKGKRHWTIELSNYLSALDVFDIRNVYKTCSNFCHSNRFIELKS